MAESIKGVEQLQKDLDNLSKKLLDDKFLTQIGSFARKEILARTNEGKDYKGRSFTDYAPSTNIYRRKRGRQVGHVDLQDRRHMLNNITVKTQAIKDSVKLVFTRGEERQKAFYHTEVGVGKSKIKREFFKLGKEVEDDIEVMIDKRIRKLLK